jgi:hypothetical protein
MNHIKRSKIIIILSLAMLLVLVGAMPAYAEAERLNFTGTTCIQSQTPGRTWISDDGILHDRGGVLTNINTADSDYGSGIMILTGNIDLDLDTGNGHTYGTLVLYPSAYDGTFVGSWSSHISAGSLRGISVAHGTGDLEGLQMFVDLSGDNPLSNPCTNADTTILIP